MLKTRVKGSSERPDTSVRQGGKDQDMHTLNHVTIIHTYYHKFER